MSHPWLHEKPIEVLCGIQTPHHRDGVLLIMQIPLWAHVAVCPALVVDYSIAFVLEDREISGTGAVDIFHGAGR